LSISHYIRRGAEELAATARIARYVGLPDALATLKGKIEIQRMCRDGYREPPVRYKALVRKHEVMLRYYHERYREFFDSYDFSAPIPKSDDTLRGKVWVCWWQGLDYAPEIVRACVDSIRRAAFGHDVIVLDESNYRDYADMPDWLVDKFKNGIISRTQFSDCLRFTLLAQHGGIWLDATVFCSAPLPSDAFERGLFTISRPDCDHMSPAAGRFSDFCLGCNDTGRREYASIRDAYYLYWRTNNMLIDYLTNDYMIVLLQLLDPEHVGRAFAAVEPSNPRMADLLIHLNDQYDAKLWEEIKADTSIFKLSWKVPVAREVDGRETFYGKLLSGELS
jgi:hypothetical protein